MAIELLFRSGMPYKRRGNEVIYKECPFCGNEKYNCQVSLTKGVFHCWACDRGGRLRGMSVLASGFGVHYEEPQISEKEILVLPETARPMWLHEQGAEYLKMRGVEESEARRLGMLYDEGNVYVPYFVNNELAAFNVRTAEGKWIFHGEEKENLHFTIPGRTDYVVLVEGTFDGIKVSRTGHNVFVMFGRVLFDNQLDKLIDIYDKFILALDNDKAGVSATLSIAKKLDAKGVDIFRASPPETKKDFGECTTEEVLESFRNMTKLGMAGMLRLRMNKK